MKKALIGCGIALVVLVFVGGGAFYYFVYKPASSYLGSVSQLAEVAELNEQVQDQGDYQPPGDSELTEAQVQRFMRVQSSMREKMGRRFEALEKKYEQLDQELNQQGREAGYREVLGAWRDMAGLILAAKRQQVKALNAEYFSVDEYAWVRGAVYRAAGAAVPTATFGEMVNAVRQNGQGQAESPEQKYSEAVPEKNRRLVAPHAERLKKNVGLAWFGL